MNELDKFQKFIEFIQEGKYSKSTKEKANNALEILGLYYNAIGIKNEI